MLYMHEKYLYLLTTGKIEKIQSAMGRYGGGVVAHYSLFARVLWSDERTHSPTHTLLHTLSCHTFTVSFIHSYGQEGLMVRWYYLTYLITVKRRNIYRAVCVCFQYRRLKVAHQLMFLGEFYWLVSYLVSACALWLLLPGDRVCHNRNYTNFGS